MNRIDVRWNVREQCAELVVDGRSLEEIVDPERAWGGVALCPEISAQAAEGDACDLPRGLQSS